MPRLYHRKSTLGCIRCKKRRVKCDEQHPKCGACTKHNVECHYAPIRRPPDENPQLQLSQPAISGLSPVELRLLHNFLLYTSHSFSNVSDYWSVRAGVSAYSFRPFFDGILALSALHLYRQAKYPQHHEKEGLKYDFHVFLAGDTPQQMQQKSICYLHRAIQGVRESLTEEGEPRDYESLIVGSALITINSMFLLAEDDNEDETAAHFNGDLWLRLGIGPRELAVQRLVCDPIISSDPLGLRHIRPDLRDCAEMFNAEAGIPFNILLDWGSEFEYLTEKDQEAYQQTINYIGVIYNAIRDRSETPLATARRFNAFPSRAPPRFVELALEQRPRAMVLLAHVFALMKLLSRDVYWFDGIADKQIPIIYEHLPQGWRAAMQFPLAVLDYSLDDEEPLPYPPSMDNLQRRSSEPQLTVSLNALSV